MKTTDDKPSFVGPMKNFTRNLSGLHEFLTLIQAFLDKEAKDWTHNNLTDLIPIQFALAELVPNPEEVLPVDDKESLKGRFGAEFTVEKIEDGGVRISIEGDAGKRVGDAIKGLSLNSRHKKLLYRNCLISLISSAEWFLSQVLRRFFEAHPDAASVKEKTLTLADLQRIGSVSEAEAYLITLRIDEIMWGGLDDWLRFLKATVKLSMGYLGSEEAELTEVFQRRNVMVHNDGKVHHSYFAKVAEGLRAGIKEGEELEVTPEYLSRAIDVVETNFLLIAAELWKKLHAKDESRASILNDITIDALFNKRYSLALGTSRFQMEDRQLSEKWILYAKLNHWQSHKWAGTFAQVEDDVKKVDFTAKGDLLQLARFVLLDDFAQALELLEPTLRAGKLTLDDLESWPIFQNFRMNETVKGVIAKERAKASATVQITGEDIKEVANSNELLLSLPKELIN